jgi:K+-transporting ATPase ATPase C chain
MGRRRPFTFVLKSQLMKRSITTALKLFLLLTLLTGALYPLAVTGVTQLICPFRANGSIIAANGQPEGSELIGQPFAGTRYFHPRPSACNYTTLPSSASNLGPTSDTLKKMIELRRREFITNNNLPLTTAVPVEMVTASASGLDPHISVQSARLQAGRVAAARGFSPGRKEVLLRLIDKMTEKKQFGVLGERRVNVLLLNRAVDKIR